MGYKKGLVYFTTSLKSNESVLDRLQKCNLKKWKEYLDFWKHCGDTYSTEIEFHLIYLAKE